MGARPPARLVLSPRIRHFSTTFSRRADFTHAIVGGGAVGLAVARRLQQRDGVSTVLIERHGSVGTETSSRNSEVIHAGIYYKSDSLKARLCIKGKDMLYSLCSKHDIPHKNVGKLVVAQDDAQRAALDQIHATAKELSVPTEFRSSHQVESAEPLVRAAAGALWSPSTGILDSHTYMAFLHGSFTDSGGDTALSSTVSSIAPSQDGSGWDITVQDPSGTTSTISAEMVINSAGLAAVPLANMTLPESKHLKAYFAKGTYYSVTKRLDIRTLVYPAPVEGHGGLGTHLTLDLQGRVRFGPDLEWVDNADDLAPTDDPERSAAAVKEIQSYLPSLSESDLDPDYCGIRPKIVGKGMGNRDFYISRDGDGLVNLCGIESPGLTSSLSIAEEVHDLLYR